MARTLGSLQPQRQSHISAHPALLALLFSLFLLIPGRAPAVVITGTQVSPTEWSYDLTFAPLDNYSVFQQLTTITLTGLFGVTGAAGPTSTDFPSAFIDAINLDWSAQVLDGGTTVQWTHIGPGTGNFGSEQHIFEFRVFADGAVDGLVSLATDGFSRDTTNPLPGGSFELDIAGVVAGPVAAAVPEPGAIALIGIALAALGFSRRRKQ